MKRISDYTRERMNMKQMATIYGGSATNFSDSMLTYSGCGDCEITYTEDGYVNGQLTITKTTHKTIMKECP